MKSDKFIAYYRLSTQRQGASGLGLYAQKQTVETYVKNAPGSLLAEFCEVETAKGANSLAKRPELRKALDQCRREGAILVIAKLDRLARNVHVISGLMESRVRFVACDIPEANELTLHVLAAFAEHEAKRISQRTKEALAQARARGSSSARPRLPTSRRYLNADKAKPSTSRRSFGVSLTVCGFGASPVGIWSRNSTGSEYARAVVVVGRYVRSNASSSSFSKLAAVGKHRAYVPTALLLYKAQPVRPSRPRPAEQSARLCTENHRTLRYFQES